jgi:hypothetical protein
MQFKQYLQELANIEVGQAFDAHETSDKASSDVLNPKVFTEVNHRLIVELNEPILAPESGIQKIRKVLHRFGMDMPALYEADPEGDEVIIGLKQFGQAHGATIYGDYTTGTQVVNKDFDAYLYFLYYLEDNGLYVFHAEMTTEEGLAEILSDEDEDEEDYEELE